jgi:glycosyltransferase involved in cell wall biosynthesis
VKLSIVIPAYNERHTLPALISAVGAVLPTVAKEIIIVDDGR